MKTYTIQGNDSGQRADKFLTKALPRLPKSLLYKYLRLKRIKLNGKRCEISTLLHTGDEMQLYISDEFFLPITEETAFLSAPDTLDILYEDEHLLLLNKRPGLVVHESEGEAVDTLINRVLHYLYKKGEYSPETEQSFRPSLCNRIDRNTCGIVIAAKTAAALRVMNQKMKDREIKKLYLCIVHGQMKKKEDTLTGYLSKDSDKNLVTVRSAPFPGARTILTRYRVLEMAQRYSLLQVDLLTGRTHQIRAHLAYSGHPLLGDTKYGTAKLNAGTGRRYQALCAYRLEFHFTTGAGELEYLNGRSFQLDSALQTMRQELQDLD